MNANYSRNPEQGYSMIEVMATIVIVSFGLLGLAGMFTKISQFNNSSVYRSIAAQQAYDMADRLRSNPDGVKNGNYDEIEFDGGQECTPCTSGSSCSSAQLAEYDACSWNNQNLAQLPLGRGDVTGTTSGGLKTFTISVWWDNKRTGDVEQLKTFQLTVVP